MSQEEIIQKLVSFYKFHTDLDPQVKNCIIKKLEGAIIEIQKQEAKK